MNLLSSTLSSFDFDEDSSEDNSEELDISAARTRPLLLKAINHESEVIENGKLGSINDRIPRRMIWSYERDTR